MDSESVRRWQFWFWLLFRKIAIAFGIYACIAVIFLVLYCVDLSHHKNNVIPAGAFCLALLGGLIVFIFVRGKDFIKRLWYFRSSDYFAILVFLILWWNTHVILHSSFTEICLCASYTKCFIIVLTVLFLVKTIIAKTFRQNKNSNAGNQPLQHYITNLSGIDILKWVQDDKPSGKDYLGFTPTIQTIKDRLINSIHVKGNTTIGLRGQFGSGKTTITEIIANIAKNEKKRLFLSESVAGVLIVRNQSRDISSKK